MTLKIPFFIIYTKIDITPENVFKRNIENIQNLVIKIMPNGEKVTLTEEYIKKTLQTYKEREEAHQRNRRTAFKVLETQ